MRDRDCGYRYRARPQIGGAQSLSAMMIDPRANLVRIGEDDIGPAHFADANQRGAELESLTWASATGINESHGPWSFEITGFQAFNPKACGLHQVIRFAIEMAAARNALPDWREPVLPSSHANFRCAAMFGEAKDAPGFEYPANFHKRPGRVVDAAKREGHYHRVDALVVQRQGFS